MELKNYFAQDDQGNKLPGAMCYLYQRGTENPAGGAKKANGVALEYPFHADTSGLVQFAAPNGLYDLRVVSGDRDFRIPVQFNDVGESVAAAELAALQAATAADAAQLSAGVYQTIASGLLATAHDRYFSVPSPESDEFLILYRNNAGVEVEVKRYSSAAAITQMKALINSFSDGGSTAFSFEDENRFPLMKLLVDGSLDMLSAKLRNAGDGLEVADPNGFVLARLGASGSNINGLVTKPSEANGIEFLDDHGFVIGRFDSNKAFFGPPPPAPAVLPPPSALLDQQLRTDIIQVIGYGQSLSRGVQSIPAISLVQPFQNIMLASGVRTRATDPGYNPSAFVPLVEAGDVGEGETPVAGICNGVTRRAVADGESESRWVFVGTAPGRSGRSVEQLSPLPMGSSNDFENMVKTVADTKALADSLGKSYSVWAYAWEQGESNYIDTFETSPYQYMQYQLNLFETLTEKVVGITGQRFRPFLFSYQVGAHRKYGKDAMPIALAQWRISRQREDVVLAVPVYIFKVAADNLHLTNEASWLLGEYKSRAMFETMIRRNGKWRPLEPIAVDWKQDHVDIQFHVPRGELVLDAELAALTTNFGFDIREAGAVVPDLITGVTVNAPGSVRLTLSRPAAADAILSYGRGRPSDPAHSGPATGARGNLRDTHGLYDTAVSPLGNTFALHNPCVMFQYDRKTGF
ncbi:hypothetical protein HCU66_20750 [Pseudomonas frederiksbergensis]|uniref:hypothetical protein n=1 Tax=Pseudomonas frederiksbergensis TaxID=104087 RepID=UPI00197F8B7E|nr:hypothetical protein [Pseudomonas frederiksbergensis]MBN3864665.1 hypothetical protein [Pseudomonas frederiksbergensis]